MSLRQPIHFCNQPYFNFYDYPKYSGEVFLRINDHLPYLNFSPDIFISNYGRVFNNNKERFKNTNMYIINGDNNQYASITNRITGKSYQLHRIELSCFVEDKMLQKEYQPDHINGIKNDNRLNLFNPDKNNIEWVTRSENITRAYNLGLSKTGEANVHSNITNEDARKVIALLATGQYTSKQIVEMLQIPNLTIHIVDDIRKKEAWARESEGIEFKQRINRQFTEQDIHNFCKVFQDLYQEDVTLSINDKCREALRRNGFEPDMRYVETLRKVYVRKYYHHITSQYKF